jgi:hypothetical protein
MLDHWLSTRAVENELAPSARNEKAAAHSPVVESTTTESGTGGGWSCSTSSRKSTGSSPHDEPDRVTVGGGAAAAKRDKKVANATALIWQTLLIADRTFRKLDSPELAVSEIVVELAQSHPRGVLGCRYSEAYEVELQAEPNLQNPGTRRPTCPS